MSETNGLRTPLRIGRSWRIVPPGGLPHSVDPTIDLVVPLGAFGSGEHETTASCLEELEELAPFDGMRALDVGCGTGILALAALRLGADCAVGVDISAKAAVTTRRSACLNQLGDRIAVVLGPLDAVKPAGYGLVLANLHGDLLLELAESIVAAAGPTAPIVLSGIAWEYAFPVREEFTSLGCNLVRERWLEEYLTLVLTAPTSGL